ncbi:MAG: GTPase HflX [Caldilineaceae bacterium]|nr:GTPase HflX [Caldilineaceae bacterium]MCB9161531.1 GTPase HflX [Caldilineaceae bacterium]
MTNPESFGANTTNGKQLRLDPDSRQTVLRDEQGLVPTMPPAERAVLVGVELHGLPGLLSLQDSLEELALLADTAGLEVVGTVTQRLDTPNPATLIGTGKLEELEMTVLESGANVVVFDDELSPRQQRELEAALGEEVKVIDRTALILDIFASHARTREGSVQVELAQYEYRLPRLTRAWTHLARQAGGRAGGASGGVGVRGPGETQLEVDRREINRRIAFLKRQLVDIEKHRDQYRQRRRKSAIPVIAVVGYTNAGKSTLLNALTGAGVVAQDQLFATLDPTTRRVELPSGHIALFTDTVGFIQKLPTTLVAAFRATLEEVNEARILLHVVDASHINADEQVAAVEEVLEELGAGNKPVVTALNKVDLLDLDDPEERHRLEEARQAYPHAVAISARTGAGMDRLLSMIDTVLFQQMVDVDVLIPYARGELVALFHEHGFIEQEEHLPDGTHIAGRLPVQVAGRYGDLDFSDGPAAV